MTELVAVGRNTWQGLTLPLQGWQQRVCSKQSARLMPGQTGFNRQRGRPQQRANAKDGVGCTVAYQLVYPRMGCCSTFVSSAASFAGKKKCSQRHNHSSLHICKIRQEEG